MDSVKVKTLGGSYAVHIEPGIIKRAGQKLHAVLNANKLFIITDENVQGLYGGVLRASLKEAGFDTALHVLKPGEREKSVKNLERILRAMAREGVTRSDTVLALGGGVVGDIAGFAAAVYMRGIPWAGVPTTLLSQIDASVGGKTAVDLPEGKNLAGAFHQPKVVLIDPEVLATLPKKQMKEGMAEMIKYACIADKDMFSELLSSPPELQRHIINCCEIKRRVVEEDERDTGLRMILNFGHTIGHALEAAAGYRYMHGQAVAAGMAHITERSEQMGLTKEGTSERLRAILKKYGLPVKLPQGMESSIPDALARDKKMLSGKLNLVLLKEIGSCYIYPVDLNGLRPFVTGG